MTAGDRPLEVAAPTRAAASWLSRLSSAVDSSGDVRAIAWLRIAAGPIVIAHLSPFLDLARQGLTYADRFYQPFASWYPQASPAVYRTMLYAAVVAAVLLSVGAVTRVAAACTAIFVAYNLFLSITHFHHNRAFLTILLAGLAALPSGRHLSIDSLVRRRWPGSRTLRPARLWPLWALRYEVAMVYVASGTSKLVDPDWWGGTVTATRVEWGRSLALDRGVPAALLDALADPGFQAWLAKVIVLTELFIGLGLLWKRTRLAAVWVAIPFHVSIQAVAMVQVFSYAALAALVIWVTPAAGDRTVIVRGTGRVPSALGWAARRLDWFGRFRVVRAQGGSPSLTLIDRPGRAGTPVVLYGPQAARMILTRLPLTFWPAAPALLPGLRSVWDRALRAGFADEEEARSEPVTAPRGHRPR